MPSLYPQAQLLQIKPKERLSELINKLEPLQEFYGEEELLQKAQSLVDKQDVQVEEINTYIGEIKNFIELNSPIKEKLDQVNYLMQCVDFCLKDEVHTINSELGRQKDQLEQFKNHGLDNVSNSESILAKLDLIFINQIEKLFNKIKEIYSKRELGPKYKTYFENQIGLIQSIEKDQKTKACFPLRQLPWLMDFLKKFEDSSQQFYRLEVKFKNDKDKYLKLCKELINSERIYGSKKMIEQQIEILNKCFSDFDPQSNFHEQLNLGLIQLDNKLSELSTIKQVELRDQQEQYAKLIELLIASKVNLIQHANKLKSSFLWAQSGKNKYQAIENIQKKMDALLESVANQAHASKQIIINLQQTINEAKTILSVYRGIPLLRCFATLWGGGKVTSQLLVQTLEEQLIDLQSNIHRLQA